ncbi:hypothetical protein G6F68_000452 [Rhizopus microsporus]|nr:hypothetical protein G6F67_000238 [Rhizopus microsporus]KAG1269206.1 hypothetical protein G6F68_000452 [Rhizopus microsporus]
MEQSIYFAKEAISNIKNSIIYGKRSGYYAQMDAESENEEEYSHSLFYSVHQSDHINEDSIPLSFSNAYSDRSQLLFEQSDVVSDIGESYEESPKPSAIYLDPILEPSSTLPPLNPKSLTDSLLPITSSIPPEISQMDRKYKDPIFALLYGIAFSIFLISGIIILFTTDTHAVEDLVKESTFKVIKDSAGMLATVIATSLVIATFWLIILRIFTKALVWGTVICVPVALSVCFIWSLVESLQYINVYEGNEEFSFRDTGLTWISIIPLILNLIYIKIVYDRRHRINKTISVIELACDMIRSNPAILIVPILLLTVFILFTSIWITFFNRLWLIGRLSNPSTLSKAIWIVNNYVYYLAAFYIFFYMWTSMILIYLEKFALSGMTAQWYFHRNEISSTSMSYSKKTRPLVSVVEFILRLIDPIVSTVNHYTVGLAGITGENFFSAAKSATKIFRRNLLSGIFGDFLTQIILHIGTAVIALTTGLSAYIYATHQLHSPHGFVVGLIGTLTPYYISQFYSYVMMSIIDATFLCYAIDLDTGTVHFSAAHSAFSGYD